jgi:hypothetical protein
MTKAERTTFIEKHGLWSDRQKRLVAEIARLVSLHRAVVSRLSRIARPEVSDAVAVRLTGSTASFSPKYCMLQECAENATQ